MILKIFPKSEPQSVSTHFFNTSGSVGLLIIRELQGDKNFLLDYREIWNHEDVWNVLYSEVLYID
jgi:hypothetical protein